MLQAALQPAQIQVDQQNQIDREIDIRLDLGKGISFSGLDGGICGQGGVIDHGDASKIAEDLEQSGFDCFSQHSIILSQAGKREDTNLKQMTGVMSVLMVVMERVAQHIYERKKKPINIAAMKNTILLTGASGSVGFEAFQELLRRGDNYHIRILNLDSKFERKLFRKYHDQVEIIWGNLCNTDDVRVAVQGVDTVIHTAAVIPPQADHDPDLAWQVNTGGTRNLVKALKEHNPACKLVYTSSISVYGDRIKYPNIRVGEPLRPSLGDEYAKTKIAAEKIIQASGLKWSIFRLCGILTKQLSIQPLMFHMPLGTALEWCHASDAGLALANAVECASLSGRIFNLGGGQNCRAVAHDFLKTMLNIFGIDFSALPKHAFATRNFHSGFYTDGEDLNKELGFQRATLQDYYTSAKRRVPPWKRTLMGRIPRPMIREYFERMSEPLKAIRANNLDLIARFYGSRREFDRLPQEIA
jgi:nucleoside-diphosphate-sugar epimerase